MSVCMYICLYVGGGEPDGVVEDEDPGSGLGYDLSDSPPSPKGNDKISGEMDGEEQEQVCCCV